MDEVILSRIRQEAYEQGYQDGKVDGYNLAGTRMSSAKQERKKGKWIWMGEKGDSRFMCSVCKSKENVPTCNGKPTIWWYCPNCGADMRKETEDAKIDI